MDVLFHASSETNLKLIEPKRTLSKDKYIGDFIFATSDKRLASMYLATRGNPTLMNCDGPKPYIVICNNPTTYIENDSGGAIYTLAAKTFNRTPQKGLDKSELVSEVSVKPLDKKVYSTSVEAMRECGINIYFVDEYLFNQLITAKDELVILSSLKPYYSAQ